MGYEYKVKIGGAGEDFGWLVDGLVGWLTGAWSLQWSEEKHEWKPS